jgi:hypothetical protein
MADKSSTARHVRPDVDEIIRATVGKIIADRRADFSGVRRQLKG